MATHEVNGRQVEIKVNKIDSRKSPETSRIEIIKWLGRIGITSDYIVVDWSRYGHQDPFAEVRWVVNEEEYVYRCTTQETGAKCLAAVEQLVHFEVIFIERGIKTFAMVMNQFKIGYEGEFAQQDPYDVLGIQRGMKDKDYITYRYKQLAKEHHPDKGGSEEKFKAIQDAYKSLMDTLN